MIKSILTLLLLVMIFLRTSIITASSYDPHFHLHHFARHLTLLPGQSARCKAALRNDHLTVDVYYWYNKPLNEGMANILLRNPTPSNPPINIRMARGGFSDRVVFDRYYSPLQPMYINNREFGLYAAIFNMCFDGQKQVAFELNINPVNHCMMTTATWNYCR